MNFKKLHIFFIQPILNCMPFFWIDIFYDNYTYLDNHGHFFFVLLWSLSTLYGLYTYALDIWKKYAIPYHKKKHTILCLGMFLVIFIPYQSSASFFNDLHVWLFILCFLFYLNEWKAMLSLKDGRLLFIGLLFCLSTFLIIGSMTCFTESLCSLFMNSYFYYLSRKKL